MNKVTFPLAMDMKQEAVADLHAALKFLKVDVAEEEISEKHYGEETVAAVNRFQADNGLAETGRVDEETAHVLNQKLHDAGYLGDHDSYVVRGQISGQAKYPVPGLLVRAIDTDPSGENSLGGPEVTDDDGRYSIVYYDHQFRIAGHESGNADVVVRVYDPDNSEKPLEESKMHRNAPRDITIDLSVDYEPSAQPQDDDDDKFVVKGLARYLDGKPGANLRVKAFDVRLRRDDSLGEDKTNQDGSYEIVYTRKQFRHSGKRAVDLRVRAYTSKDQEIAYSDIVFSADEVEEINLTIGNTAYRGPSEYEQLITLLEPQMRGLNFAELREDDEHQDVTFLSGNTGAEPRLVAFLIAAKRLSARTSIPAQIFYGIFRYDLPVNLPALMVQDPVVLRRALETAVADNIIPDGFADEIDNLPARFKELVVREAIRPTKTGETKGPLVALLSTTLSDTGEQEKFLERYVAHSGPIEEFWKDISASPEFEDKVEDLQFTIQAGALTGNHLPLVEKLQSMRAELDPNQKITSMRDLVRFNEVGWRKMLGGANGQGVISAPSGVPGKDDEEKLENYARSLDRAVERDFPTAYVAERLKDDDLPQKANLLRFFQDNQDTFDITGARLETFLDENPGALDGVAEKDRPAVKQQLRAWQRIYRFAPKYTATSALLKEGIQSAAAVTRMGPTLFALKHSHALGTSNPRAAARRVYARAEGIHAMSLALLSTYGLDGVRLPMHVMKDEQPDLSGSPSLQTLFGSLELCGCEHCRSVYSPAAYLVDLLHYLQDRQLIDPNNITRDAFGRIDSPHFLTHPDDPNQVLRAKDVLFQRRADLGEIELTCENTNTAMPYVDLVNEVLEDRVAPPPIFSPFALDPARVADLDNRLASVPLRTAFTAPPLSEHATIEVQKHGEQWRIHDLAFTYTVRKEENGPLEVTARSRQTSSSPEELAANPQYLNPEAYENLRQAVFPLTLPFDLWHTEARIYLGHLGVQRSQVMELLLPSNRAEQLANPALAREWLNLTPVEAELITGGTAVLANPPQPWNLWGFADANPDIDSLMPDSIASADCPNNDDIGSNWLDVLAGRVDVFLQQSGLKYKGLLNLLGAYYVNPVTNGNSRLLTLQARAGAPQDTCEPPCLRIAGMDQDQPAALRSLRFIRLWRKIGWSMRDLDRALSVLNVGPGDPIRQAVLTQLGLIQRLRDLLGQPVEKLLPFWGPIDTQTYIDHDASGQPPFPSLYEQLFRNKSVLNPPDLDFPEDHQKLSGSLSGHAATISAALGISVADLAALHADPDVIPHIGGQPDDTLSLVNLSRLYRHATLAKMLRLPIRDYLAALELHGNPFADPGATTLFVEYINAVRASGLTLSELDYLSRHMIMEASRVAPTEEEIAQVLAELRAELQRIAAENTFVEDPDAPNGPTVDLQGDLTREKLALLGWDSGLIDEAVATLGGSVTYRTPLAALPAGVSLPADMPQIVHDTTAGQLQFVGVMTITQRNALNLISGDNTYKGAVTNLFNAPRRFVQRNMRRYIMEHFKTPLVTLPGITFPVALDGRVYHDVEAGDLYFIGAMSENDRDELLRLSLDNNFQTAINALYAAPDTPPSADSFLTSGGAGSDTEALFDVAATPADRFDHVLRKLMPHLHNLFGERAVTQKLAEAFGLETQTTRDLLTQWLDWTGQPGQKLLAAFLDPGFAKSNPNIAITRAAFAEQFDAYLRLHKIALIVERFECTPRQVGWLFNYASAAGWPDLTALPVTPQATTVEALEAWLRLTELFTLRNRLPRGEEMLDDLLDRAAAVDGAATPADKDAAKEAFATALANWTEWPQADLEVLLGKANDHIQTGLLKAAFPEDYVGAHLLGRLQACVALLKRLGLSAEQCRRLISTEIDPATAKTIKQAVRAKYDEAQWLELARPLRDALREQQRAALVDYLLAPPDDHWRDANDLYSHFLLDVEMDPCMMTSRLKQAISSVQLFVQRCLMNLEPSVLASAEVDDRWREWDWMKNYRVWEANRKIFLYPENWIYPELRDDKTPFFQDMESELLQNDLTHDTAETAFRSYLEKLDAVARLEIVGMYHEQEEDLAVNVLHVFGRTPGIPHIYYYRRRINDDYWTAWERVDLDIEGNHLVPVVWQGRLYLIWPIFTEKANDVDPARYWEIQLARSEYKDGAWSPKKVSEAVASTKGWSYVDKRNFLFKGFSYDDRLDVRIIDTSLSKQVSPPANTNDFRLMRVDDPNRSGNSDADDNGRGNFAEETVGIYDGPFAKQWPDLFQLTGCNSDFILITRDGKPLAPASPYRLTYEYVWLREFSRGGNRLYLPETVSQSGVALDRTPGSLFRILYAHQSDAFSALHNGPWFFNDDRRTYFVTVRKPLSSYWLGETAVDLLNVMRDVRFAPAPEDPFNPAIGNVPLSRVIHPGDPLLFAETTPAAPAAGASPANLLAAETVMGSNGFRSEAASPLLVAREHLESLNGNTVTMVKRFNEYRYTFHTFYHPYMCKFIEALNRNSVDGLLQRPQQLRSDADANLFELEYKPKTGDDRLVSADYPLEEVDFNYPGPYSLYNWELFFHAPLLIANSLCQNQRFADAQRWFHYIFDPTDKSGLATPQRYWRTKPFFEKTDEDYQRQKIASLLRLLATGGDLDQFPNLSDEDKKALRKEFENLVKAVNAWRAEPFKPHLVARMRTTAYQKTVVMKYIDNLIAWGDQLFRRDTLESINEATQLYVMAADILGKRPERIPPRATPEVHTYNTIEPLLDDLSNALVQIEEFVFPSVAAEVTDNGAPLPSLPGMLYFCVPQNDQLLDYWDTVAGRLFKIRHCMNIEGVIRQLPLFAPPIDPALLVRAAAAGIDLSSVLNDVNAPLPHYRFNLLAQKATELCGELKSLSGALLATLEKRDVEKLALLRAEHETVLLKLVEQVREQQRDEAEQQLAALRASRETAVTRYMHYQKLLGAQDSQVPPEGEAIPEQEASEQASTGDQFGIKMTGSERAELRRMEEAKEYRHMAYQAEFLANILYYVPTVTVSSFVGEVEFGGVHLGHASSAFGAYRREQMADKNHQASVLSRTGQFIMREHEWVLQSNSAAKEIMNIDQQIIAADLRKAIADQEFNNHRKQIEQAQKVEETMRDKYTNQELYNWMIGQISTVYFQSYQLAYDVAKRAERAFRHELGLQDSSFIQFGYWDSLKKGLLSGDRLHHDLKRMEVAYLNQNKREFEITKHISLRQLNPAALIQLRETGECLISFPEMLFDLDFPGHYMRRIKNVSLTIPAVTGPYTGVPCTLSLVRSSVRRTGTLPGGQYDRDSQNDDSRFSDAVGAIQSIVTSGGQNDSGLFETNLRDERFLPFEGAGVISTWRIELPAPEAFPPFDYDTIADVVLHMRYTARDGGPKLKTAAKEYTDSAIGEMVESVNQRGLFQLLSMKHEFGTAFHKLLNPTGSTGHEVTIKLSKQHFPFLFQKKNIDIQNVIAFVKLRDTSLLGNSEFALTISRDGSAERGKLKVASTDKLGGLAHVTYGQLGGSITSDEDWVFAVTDADVQILPAALRQAVTINGTSVERIKADAVEDVGLLLQYKVS